MQGNPLTESDSRHRVRESRLGLDKNRLLSDQPSGAPGLLCADVVDHSQFVIVDDVGHWQVIEPAAIVH